MPLMQGELALAVTENGRTASMVVVWQNNNAVLFI
jgi:hypothetical protein